MAKSKKENNSNENSGSEYFILSIEKKKKIIGIFFIVFSLLIALSILSYSRIDRDLLSYQWNDLTKSLGKSSNGSSASSNLLGIIGVYVSDFVINSTIGYFGIVFPAVIFLWGISFFKKFELKFLLNISNFLLIMGLLTASLLGLMRMKIPFITDYYEISGAIGDYVSGSLTALIGAIGTFFLLITLMVVTLIISFDIKIEKLFSAIVQFFTKEDEENEKEEEIIPGDKKSSEEKKKKPKLSKKNGAIVPPDTEDAEAITEEFKEDTQIRIIRKDEAAKEVVKPPLEVRDSEDANKPKVIKDGEPLLVSDREAEKEKPEPWEEKIKYTPPSLELLEEIPVENYTVAEEELNLNAERLKEKLALFDIQIDKIDVTPGPVVTLYEIVPAPGVKISKIVSLEHDIALALAAKGIRIIAPIPGKSAIGVEIPNSEPSKVVAKSVLAKIHASKAELPLALGKTIAGDIYVADLSKMPHLLVAGSTGSGKSVGINMMIASLLYSKNPADVKIAMIDPKKIELSFYNKLRSHFLAVCPDLDEDIVTIPTNAVILLKSVEYEMEKRYDKLAKAGVRNIVDYNLKVSDPNKRPKDTETIKHHYLPYIVVIIDELADLMITAGKEVEEPIARLAQLARAVGIHLVLATQRPSVNVITGVIKANFSARMAYQVATKIDSRTILDMNGAEQLLGRGDMLFLPTGTPKPIRVQNAFITTDEVERITEYIHEQKGYSKPYYLPSLYDKKKQGGGGLLEDLDPLFEDAARVIVKHQQGSVSLLQRRLKLGYARAARIVDQLEEAGIVGPNDGSKAREVIVENEEQLETILRNI